MKQNGPKHKSPSVAPQAWRVLRLLLIVSLSCGLIVSASYLTILLNDPYPPTEGFNGIFWLAGIGAATLLSYFIFGPITLAVCLKSNPQRNKIISSFYAGSFLIASCGLMLSLYSGVAALMLTPIPALLAGQSVPGINPKPLFRWIGVLSVASVVAIGGQIVANDYDVKTHQRQMIAKMNEAGVEFLLPSRGTGSPLSGWRYDHASYHKEEGEERWRMVWYDKGDKSRSYYLEYLKRPNCDPDGEFYCPSYGVVGDEYPRLELKNAKIEVSSTGSEEGALSDSEMQVVLDDLEKTSWERWFNTVF